MEHNYIIMLHAKAGIYKHSVESIFIVLPNTAI